MLTKTEVRPKRPVSSDDIRAAVADPDNRNVLYDALRSYAAAIHADDLETCGLHAVWRALQDHDPNRPSRRRPGEPCGQKFTTSLARFVHWECRKFLRKQAAQRRRELPLFERGEVPRPEPPPNHLLELVRENMLFLSDEQQTLLREYYLEGRTYEDISSHHSFSKEAVRGKLEKAVARLRELCSAPVY